MRSIAGKRVGLADLPRRQGLGPKWDSTTSEMTRPGWIIIVSGALKPGEGVFSRGGHDLFLFLFNQKFIPVYRVI